MESLEKLMQAALQDGGFAVAGGRDYFMEVVEIATGTQWMSAEPVTKEEFANHNPGEDYEPFGMAAASMDAALFQHSPNGEGEPVRQRMIGGRLFINVAKGEDIQFAEDPDGMSTIMVNKAHVLGFEAGRKVAYLERPEGHFVECIGHQKNDDQLLVPEDSEIKYIELKQPWIVHLPNPAKTFWWFGKGRSFQGPVTLPNSD